MTKRDGLPCKKCGTSEWYKSSGGCVQCMKKNSRKWRQAHPDTAKEAVRKWRESNTESEKEGKRKYRQENTAAIKEYNRKYYQANIAAEKERGRNYQQNNPAVILAKTQRRRTRKTQAGGSFTAAEWESLVNHYGNKCLRCGRDDVKLTADHVIPVARGGSSNIDNIQPLCGSCNSSKGDKTIDYRPGSGLGRWIQRKLFG